MRVVKRDKTFEEYSYDKIKKAITKSSERISHKMTRKEHSKLKSLIEIEIEDYKDEITVEELHGIVEKVLQYVNKDIAQSYMNYRNYKKEFELNMLKNMESQAIKILNEVDRDNSNSNTRYNATKRTEIAKSFSKELYQKMFLSVDELQAMKDGYIYVHDLSDMIIRQFNCCLLNVKNVFDGGFELESIKYNEPKRIKTAVGQLGDIIIQVSGQSFGGLSIPECDKVLAKYYKMTYEYYYKKYIKYGLNEDYAKEEARKDSYDEMKQAIQGLEIKINTTGSSRGSYPFVTVSFGDVNDEWEADVCKAFLQVRLEGHGEEGKKKRLIFPKLIFIHNEDKHNDGKEFEWLFDYSIKVSSVTMYPDYIGKGQRREGKNITPMGKHKQPNEYELMSKRCA